MSDSTWVPCVKRQEIVKHNKDGSMTPLARCTHQACSKFNTNLQAEDCAECPLRVFTKRVRPPGYAEMQINAREFGEPKIVKGMLIYPKTGWEPPKLPEGYRRLDDDLKSEGAWSFVPIWPECVDREMANTVQPCGCVQINAMCASKESEREGRRVKVDQCHACPVRRALSEQVDVQQGPVQLSLG